ncbi:MAG TPA: iron-sulfur cluster assembly accessory protein [Gammaproteobacteria bacterium]|nr:iron-sulfur cluster assembly accessory protein [Gammaproteobacteria bacterium]
MAIQLTDSAVQHVRRMLQRHEGSIGLRLGTRRSGCSGFAYVVDYAGAIEENDTVFETGGIKVLVDRASLPHLDGMTVDYVSNGPLSEGLEFSNPNASSSCGCGESVAFGETA